MGCGEGVATWCLLDMWPNDAEVGVSSESLYVLTYIKDDSGVKAVTDMLEVE